MAVAPAPCGCSPHSRSVGEPAAPTAPPSRYESYHRLRPRLSNGPPRLSRAAASRNRLHGFCPQSTLSINHLRAQISRVRAKTPENAGFFAPREFGRPPEAWGESAPQNRIAGGALRGQAGSGVAQARGPARHEYRPGDGRAARRHVAPACRLCWAGRTRFRRVHGAATRAAGACERARRVLAARLR